MKHRGRSSQSWTSLGTLFSNLSTKVSNFFGFGYTAIDPRRKLIDYRSLMINNRASANDLLSKGITPLRAHCRNLVRNNTTARAGVEAFAALLVGTGIALEPDTGDEATDEIVREWWNRWQASCEIGGRNMFAIQTDAARELPQAGEALWRIVVDPTLATADNPIPVRLLILEGEWLIDGIPEGAGTSWVAGIEMDEFGRPVKYYLQNPENGKGEIVSAEHIVHVFEHKRSMQARGEPDLAPVIETLMNERDLVDAELYAAKQTAAMAMVIISEGHDNLDTTEEGDAEDPAQSIRVGGVARLYPDEDIKAFSHNRPSQQIAPFRQMLRGDTAAALRIPQRFLDRDVSKANYSSMRADMLDTTRLLAPLREEIGHLSIGKVYRFLLPYIAVAAGLKKVPRSNYRLIPDSQPYVDPEKDIAAAVAAITAGLSTHEKESGARGEDFRQIWRQLKIEQDLAQKLGIRIDLSGTNAPAPQSSAGETLTKDGQVVDDENNGNGGVDQSAGKTAEQSA